MSTLPPWVPPEAWSGYTDMRKKIKKPMTDRAESLAIGILYKLMEEGYDVGEVLDQSTMNSWQGLFPLKERRKEPRGPVMSQLGKSGQATANNALDWLEGK